MYENHTCSCMVIIHFARKGCASTAPEQPPAPLAVEARPSLSKAGGSARTGQTLRLLSLSMGGCCLSVCPHWGAPLLFMFLPNPGHPETAAQAGESPPARATYLPRCECLFPQQFLQLLLQSFGIQSGGHDFSVGSDEQRMGNGPHAIHLARYTLPALQV